ncbi:arogenate dehydratase/prephenate dehydratase 1, chloroplastic-like isoform X6 [Camellia sinensis]|uniref:arogenate dehydratase/prephenate dehydratase 1, chloroplastic-like isoform X6 n=1 Tax=Camellia sinensis TaxID=4442 RepID=UPI00103596CC|nr:arogenate dehydratase/prephenate dehydratase 1, chloroplastic-like isoform X6 [Camellia sinensis]
MALNGVVKLGSVVPQLGWGELSLKPYGFVCCQVKGKEGVRKWECLNGFLSLSSTHQTIRSVDDDEKSSSSATELQRVVDQTEGNGSRRLQNDSTSLPRPLSVTDFSVSRNDGTKVRISFKGLPGGYSEDVALKTYPHCETVPCDEFEDAFKALAQSDAFLSKLGVARENVDDPAGAAQFVALNGLRDAGVVASVRAAEIYGLSILAERFQDDSDIVTRYLVLAREPIIPRADKPFKTSIVFTLDEGPGVLFKALSVFALRNINLTKIESRPQRKRPLRVVDDSNTGSAKYFDYLFYIDFEASMAEPRAQSALGHLQELATFLRVLGCYPRDTAQ